jgi:hypothetical protein
VWVGGREEGGSVCGEAFCGRDRKLLDLSMFKFMIVMILEVLDLSRFKIMLVMMLEVTI